MKVVEIAFMAYPVTDLKRARRFYEGLLGLQKARLLATEETRFIEDDIGPSTISIGNEAPDWIPSPEGGSVGLEVDDFDAAIALLKSSGCAFRLEPLEMPKCHMAVVLDPNRNSVPVHQRKFG